MIFLVLPYNLYTGWGVCSINLAKEICKKHKVKYVSDELIDQFKHNALSHSFFTSIKFDNKDFLKTQKDHPIIQGVQHDLSPYLGYFSGSKKIAITFADREIPKELVNKANDHYDHIIAGSEWCKNLLQQHNVKSTVIHQGIDPLIFNSSRKDKNFFLDDFLIFSGGKFEERKGQDILIKAYKVIQDRYPDVKLVCSWYNAYTGKCGKEELEKSGIDLNRVIFIPLLTNNNMVEIYQNTDIGVFPSRCEAGTNLVMMEYMACGKTAISSVETGQKDLITKKNGLSLKSKGEFLLKDEKGKVVSIWEEPDSDHLVELLDWSYNNREKLTNYGLEASKTMAKKTWEHMASSLEKLII